jgi:tetratricopeptide (TPR) repeat protein
VPASPRQVILGPSHPQAASTIVNLGNALFDLGRFAEASELYRRSLAIDEAVLGDDHPDVAMDLSNLGIVYRNMGHVPQVTGAAERARGTRGVWRAQVSPLPRFQSI